MYKTFLEFLKLLLSYFVLILIAWATVKAHVWAHRMPYYQLEQALRSEVTLLQAVAWEQRQKGNYDFALGLAACEDSYTRIYKAWLETAYFEEK